jgi:hypothetical protein
MLHEHGWPVNMLSKALNQTIGGVCGAYQRAEYAANIWEMLGLWAEHEERLEGGREKWANWRVSGGAG